MKTRLIENYVTTSIGIGIIVLSGILLYQSKIDNVAFGSLIALGLTMLRAKDTLIGIDPK